MKEGRNKIRTAYRLIRTFHNWPTAWALKLHWGEGLRTLEFRNGLRLVVRMGTGDHHIVHEVIFASSYAKTLARIEELRGGVVIDCGGHIGLFSLLAAQANPSVRVIAYEPGPDNCRVFQMNMRANAELAKRIELRQRAVSGRDGLTRWHFDSRRPEVSSIYNVSSDDDEVKMESLDTIVGSVSERPLFVKMDIEGAEYDVIERTVSATWACINTMVLEIHKDPEQKRETGDLIKAMQAQGYRVTEELSCNYLFRR